MNIVQVVASVAAESSGPSYSVPGLCRALKQVGCDVSLHALAPKPPRNFEFPFSTYAASWSPIPNLGRSRAMLSGLRKACETADIIQNNGFWMMPNVYATWAKGHAKLVTAPRGCLAAWSLNKGRFKKQIFGALLQYPAIRKTDMWYATCEKEYEEIRAAGYKQPVAIVPIGLDMPKFERRMKKANDLRRIVFFGRIHKVKGCDKLVSAWANVSDKLPEWEVVIAGPDCGALSTVKQIVAERHVPRVRYVGEINGPAKYDFLATADLYVLPTETENFGITVAEALSVETPVITTKGTLWCGLNGVTGIGRSGWWIDNDVNTLSSTILEACAMTPDALNQFGVNGRIWIERDFSWQGVGLKSKQAYEWLLDGKCRDKPDFVKVD